MPVHGFRELSVKLHLIHDSNFIQRADEAGHFAVENTIVGLRIDRLRHEKLSEVGDRDIVCRGPAGNQVAMR